MVVIPFGGFLKNRMAVDHSYSVTLMNEPLTAHVSGVWGKQDTVLNIGPPVRVRVPLTVSHLFELMCAKERTAAINFINCYKQAFRLKKFLGKKTDTRIKALIGSKCVVIFWFTDENGGTLFLKMDNRRDI